MRLLFATIAFAASLLAPAFAQASPEETHSPFAGWESPYFVFQFGPGENWIDGVDPFQQDLTGHFAYMGQLASEGVLIHGGPLDRGAGSHAMGVIRATSLAEAQAIMDRDPAVQAGVYELLSVDRWLALAGSGEGIDPADVSAPQ